MNKILLITKLKTTNIGNQALSDELIKLYAQSGKNFRVVGRPEGLYGYSIEKLIKSKDPVTLFERWTEALLKQLQTSSDKSDFYPETRFVELLSFSDFKVKNDNFYQAIKNIFRKFVHNDKLFARSYRKRFRIVVSADVLIYSGAGEVGDNNIFLRQLLELRIAQKLGKKTYAINQSVEVVDQPMQSICSYVYKQMDKILVRGNVSRDNLIQIGVPYDKINTCPDSAFLSPKSTTDQILYMAKRYGIARSTVGINVTKIADEIEKWGLIIQELKLLGYSIYFVSNDPFGDKDIGNRISKEFGIIAILDFIPYTEYSALLANFDFVISCRLHTNELSLTGGTPIIPIEGSHFKTKEVFDLVKYPIRVTNTKNPDWHKQIIMLINDIHEDSNSVKDFVTQLDNVRQLSESNLID